MGQKASRSGFNRMRVKARGEMEAQDQIKQDIIDEFDAFKAAYDALSEDKKAQCDEILGELLVGTIGQSNILFEMQLEVEENIEERLNQIITVIESEA